MGQIGEIVDFIKISNLKIGDFRMLDPECAIFDEIDFSQKKIHRPKTDFLQVGQVIFIVKLKT